MICKNCSSPFKRFVVIDGKLRNLQNRKFCLQCSPFKTHNTLPDLIHVSHAHETEKRCSNCNTIKPINEFYSRRDRTINKSVYSHCRVCANELSIKRQKKNKTDAINYKGGKCSRCGYNKYQECLEFHQILFRGKLCVNFPQAFFACEQNRLS